MSLSAVYPLVGVGFAMPRLRGCNYGCIVITAVITVITDPCFPITCNWQTIDTTLTIDPEPTPARARPLDLADIEGYVCDTAMCKKREVCSLGGPRL